MIALRIIGPLSMSFTLGMGMNSPNVSCGGEEGMIMQVVNFMKDKRYEIC